MPASERVLCGLTLASRRLADLHVREAVNRGRCPVRKRSGAWTGSPAAEEHLSMEREPCGDEFSELGTRRRA